MVPSPYSTLNNTGIYDASGFGSAKSFLGAGYDNVAQVDKWLTNVEYSLDQTEEAVRKRGGVSGVPKMSTLSLQSGGSRGQAAHFAGDATSAGSLSAAYNSRRYANGRTNLSSNIETTT